MVGGLYSLPGLTCSAIQPRAVWHLAPADLGEGRALSYYDLLGFLLVPGAGMESLRKLGLAIIEECLSRGWLALCRCYPQRRRP